MLKVDEFPRHYEVDELGPEYFEDGYNANIEVNMNVYRHGDKTEDGALSEKGIEQARVIGARRKLIEQVRTNDAGRKIKSQGVKGFHSPESRTETMVETVIDNIPQNVSEAEFKKYNTRTRKELNLNPFSKAAQAEWGKHGSSGADWYYENFYDKPFDNESLSAKEWSHQAAHHFYRHIRMAGRLKEGSKINLEEASHGGFLDAFVADAFREQIEKNPVNPDGKTVCAKMGEDIRKSEELPIEIRTDANGRLSATLLFRSKKYPVNLARLREMSEEYRKQQQEQK